MKQRAATEVTMEVTMEVTTEVKRLLNGITGEHPHCIKFDHA